MANDTPRWNIVNISQLRESIRQVLKPEPGRASQDAYRQRLKGIIAQWWQAEAQAKAREGSTTARESKAEQFRLMADMGNADWINQVRAARGQEPMHVKYLDDAVSQAGGDPTAREGLRQWALDEVEQGHATPLEVQRVLFAPSNSRKGGKPSGKKRSDHNKGLQLAAIVGVLHEETPINNLSSNKIPTGPMESGEPSSAFVFTHEATGETTDTVRNNWRDYKELFRGK